MQPHVGEFEGVVRTLQVTPSCREFDMDTLVRKQGIHRSGPGCSTEGDAQVMDGEHGRWFMIPENQTSSSGRSA